MKVINRLNKYLEVKGISAYAFERTCGVANGYIGKQLRVGGSVGSDILEKVGQEYRDLSLVWLITGEGKMLIKPVHKKARDLEAEYQEMQEEESIYQVRDRLIKVLKEQLEVLSATLPGKRRRRKKD